MRNFIGISLVVALVPACSQSRDDQHEAAVDYFRRHKIGRGSDNVLYKSGFASEREPVAVVFGFVDDEEVCQKFAERLNAEITNGVSRFYCRPVN